MRRASALVLLAALAGDARAQETGASTSGMPGGLRVVSAAPAAPGTTISASTEWFDRPGFIFEGHNHRRSAYSLAASWNASRWVSIGAAVLASTNHDSATDPVFIYAMGDVDLSARAAAPLVDRDGLRVQAGVRGGVRLMQGAAPGAKVGDSASPSARGLFTVEAKGARVSLEAGYLHDRSRFLLEDGQAIDAGQAYAWGISEYDAIVGGAALEVPIGRVTPVLELTGRHDLGAAGAPAIVATGAVRVLATERVSGFAAADLGLSGKEVRPGRLRAPDWNLVGGVSLSFGPGATPKATPRLPVVASDRGRLRGRVVDVETGAPLAGVQMEIEGRVLATDEQGRFDFGETRRGAVRLKARHPKYAPVDAPAYVTERQVTTVRVELRPAPASATAGSVVGTVFDSRDTPLAGARVAITSAGEERAVISGVDGRFRIDTKPGSFALTASAPGFDPRTEMGIVATGGSTEVIVRLAPASTATAVPVSGTGTLKGRVSGAKGMIKSATVTAIHTDGTLKRATTDAKGRFTMELAAGEWQVAVAAIGYPTQTQRCRIDGTKPISLEFILVKPTKPRGSKKKK